jgi:hypothetical protein
VVELRDKMTELGPSGGGCFQVPLAASNRSGRRALGARELGFRASAEKSVEAALREEPDIFAGG